MSGQLSFDPIERTAPVTKAELETITSVLRRGRLAAGDFTEGRLSDLEEAPLSPPNAGKPALL